MRAAAAASAVSNSGDGVVGVARPPPPAYSRLFISLPPSLFPLVRLSIGASVRRAQSERADLARPLFRPPPPACVVRVRTTCVCECSTRAREDEMVTQKPFTHIDRIGLARSGDSHTDRWTDGRIQKPTREMEFFRARSPNESADSEEAASSR